MSKNQSEQYFRVDMSLLGEVMLESLKIYVSEGMSLTEGWELHESLKDFRPKKGEIDFVLKEFAKDEPMRSTDAEVLEWAMSNGCRVAFPSERNAFFLARPDIPITEDYDRIVDLGTFRNHRDTADKTIHLYFTVKQHEGLKTPFRGLVYTGADSACRPNHRYLFVKI
ncbi:hypothetical protein IPH19_02820 [Candidatus Uhrbacteria bacterium]|nr:MAG: hypothetical protein IPH19_02820 [Candidatus Uhrbacteria bacterium]